MDLITPSSTDSRKAKEPEYVTSAGRKYALLEWGADFDEQPDGKTFAEDDQDPTETTQSLQD